MSWRTPKRRSECDRCARPFEEGEPHFSALFVAGDRVGREERCASCFEKVHAADLCWWRTTHRPEAKKGLRLDFDAMEQLFLALEGHASEKVLELRYLVALLLLRKKRLKVERVLRTAEGEAMALRRPRRKESLHVRVFDLTAERAASLQGDLMALFDGVDPETAAAESAEATPPSDAASGSDETPGDAPGEDPGVSSGTEAGDVAVA